MISGLSSDLGQEPIQKQSIMRDHHQLHRWTSLKKFVPYLSTCGPARRRDSVSPDWKGAALTVCER